MSNTAFINTSGTPPHVSSLCPRCGCDISDHPDLATSQQRIADLEAQVKLLNQKASAAVDKLADYEDEVRYLRSQNQNLTQQQQQSPGSSSSHGRNTSGLATNGTATSSPARSAINSPPQVTKQPTIQSPSNAPVSTTSTRLATLTSYLPLRRPSPLPVPNSNLANNNTPSLASPAFPPGTPPPIDLASALASERAARQKLEAQLNAQSSEVEELTAQLFSQANEMVATERKAKARLEERIKEMERGWDGRRQRLSTLEERVERSRRVRSLLNTRSLDDLGSETDG